MLICKGEHYRNLFSAACSVNWWSLRPLWWMYHQSLNLKTNMTVEKKKLNLIHISAPFISPHMCLRLWWPSHMFLPGPWFNIKMSSYQYRKSHCGDKMILRPSYLHNGISYTGKTTSLYWIRAQVMMPQLHINPADVQVEIFKEK